MSSTAPVRFVRPRKERRETGAILIQMAVSIMAGVSLFLVTIIILSLGYRLLFAGRIFPGVSVAGVDVSGLSQTAAAYKIETALTFPFTGRVVFRDGQNVWVETPASLGMSLDSAASAELAFNFGRSGGPLQGINDELNAGQVGVVLPPVILFDQSVAHAYLRDLALQINRPVVEASLVINGLDVTSQPGEKGRRLNPEASLVYLYAQLQSFRDGEVPLVVEEELPQVLDASAQAEAARRLLAAPFTIALPDARAGDPGPWLLQPADLAPMLRVGRIGSGPGSQYVVQFDHDQLQALLEDLSKQIDRPEADARFLFNDQTSQLEPTQASAIGLKLDMRGSIEAIESAAGSGQQNVLLKVNTTQPKVADTATGQQLGITQLVSSQTTYFYGSSAARLKNIQTAAANFRGLLVAPGETFSMGEHMGDVTLDSGYAEALIIYNGKTIKGVGGGVCQVSTTLFRTVFFGGFPVAERHAHAYRVYYYEQRQGGGNDPNFSGMDATVYFPLIDFKFTNDTPYWLLMETYFDAASYSLTWKFYSTSDGRAVQWDTSGPVNIVPALPPTITYNPEAEPGSLKHVDYAAQGADVSIDRVVTRDSKIWFVDKFDTHYQPWADACEYGPDVKDPEKAFKKKNWCQKP